MSSNKQQGDYLHIPLSQVVAGAKRRLRLESSDEDIFLEAYANEGARHFDSLSTFIKKDCEIEIVNGKGKLPNGFYQMLSLRAHNQNESIYVDMPFLKGCGVSNTFLNGFCNHQNVFQIQDGYIYFTLSDNRPQGGVTPVAIPKTTNPPFITNNVHINYISMNVDGDGLMVVYADMERGLVAYCVWMYMLDYPAGKYTPMQIESNKKIYENQKAWYKSIQFQNNFRNTRRQVSALANAYITEKEWYI